MALTTVKFQTYTSILTHSSKKKIRNAQLYFTFLIFPLKCQNISTGLNSVDHSWSLSVVIFDLDGSPSCDPEPAASSQQDNSLNCLIFMHIYTKTMIWRESEVTTFLGRIFCHFLSLDHLEVIWTGFHR